MPNIQIKDFNTLVTEQATAIQGGASRALVDFSVGSILRAVVEAYSAVALWLQGLVLQLLATTRAATSSGADLDSWVGDYGVARLPAAAATGLVTFARFTPTLPAAVPVGALVQTADGAQRYAVAADPSNPAYVAGQIAYVLAAGTPAVTVPVAALAPGTAANAAAGAINTLGQAIAGVDTAVNAAALTNGADAESDAALRARFVAYIASLAKSTKPAIGYAVTSIKTGISYTLTENEQYGGGAQPGYFYLVVDDGTGYPAADFLAQVYAAVDAVRPVASTFGVFPPDVLPVDVAAAITTAPGYGHAATAQTVAAALTGYIDALALGQMLSWSRLIQVAYDASPGVQSVTALSVGDGTAGDLRATARQIIKAGAITVN